METLYIRAISVIRSCTGSRQLSVAKDYYKLALKRMNIKDGTVDILDQTLWKELDNKKCDLANQPIRFFFKGRYWTISDIIRERILSGSCHLKWTECNLHPGCPNRRPGRMLICADADEMRKINWSDL